MSKIKFLTRLLVVRPSNLSSVPSHNLSSVCTFSWGLFFLEG